MSSNHAAKNPTKKNRNADPAHSPAPTGATFGPTRTTLDSLEWGVRSYAASLDLLCSRDDGWLRVIPPRDGNTLYLKWKFTQGQHSNTYVMVVVNRWECEHGLSLLCDKVAKVDLGQLEPCADTWYKHEG